jgi:hypothetical protein
MFYKITQILHNGTFGKYGTERTDGEYLARKGRIVEVVFRNIKVGIPLILHYVTDEEGNACTGKYLISSPVNDFYIGADHVLRITTRNSIYELVSMNMEEES